MTFLTEFNTIDALVVGASATHKATVLAFDHCLKAMIANAPEVEAECPVKHHFAPGMYIRELFVPKDTFLVGEAHRTSFFNVLIKGKILVATENGGTKVLEAPWTGVTEIGTKRAGYAIEDTVWLTFHITNETDPEKIKANLIMTEEEFIQHIEDLSKKELLETK